MKRKSPSEQSTISTIITKKQKVQHISIAKLQHRRNKLLNAIKNYNLKSNNSYLKKHCSKDLLTLIEGFHLRGDITVQHQHCYMIEYLTWIKVCPFILSQITMTSQLIKNSFCEPAGQYSTAGLMTMSIKNCYPCPEISYDEKKNKIKNVC